MLINTRKYFLVLLILLSGWIAGVQGIAQDPLFSQFHMAPMQFNPAFAGNTYAPLIHLNSRMQWPSIDLAYNTVSLSYDQFFKKYNSGLGFAVFNDRAGNGIINTLRMESYNSYSLRIKDDNYVKMGLGFSLVQKRLNWQKLIFPDQLDPAYGSTDKNGDKLISGELQPDNLTLFYPDISVGILYYSPDFYAGISIAHGNTPDDDFLNTGINDAIGLSNRYTAQIGAQFSLPYTFLHKTTFLSPSLLYARQANLNQINGNLILDMGTIYAGVGYRYVFENPDAVIMSVGFQNGLYKIGYSYDLTVSKLTTGSGGSHELGLIINFDHSEWFEKPNRYSDCFEVFR